MELHKSEKQALTREHQRPGVYTKPVRTARGGGRIYCADRLTADTHATLYRTVIEGNAEAVVFTKYEDVDQCHHLQARVVRQISVICMEDEEERKTSATCLFLHAVFFEVEKTITR